MVKKKSHHKHNILGVILVLIFGLGSMTYIFYTYAYASIQTPIQEHIYQPSIVQTQEENKPHTSEVLQKKLAQNLNEMIDDLRKNYNNSFDLQSDSSLQRYIGDDHVFGNINYEPLDLVAIDQTYIINEAYRPEMRASAAKAFNEMAEAFHKQFGLKLYVLSVYRSSEDQKILSKNGCSFEQCAKPGGSEHQAGLAIDIHVADKYNNRIKMGGKWYAWLKKNGHKYGFHNTYQKGVYIDNKRIEKRHRRYCGKSFATLLHKKNLTITEYYKIIQEKSETATT